ncbi:hypothetical protein CNBI0430 [Cryptococcus deneoformans B-3501A]|uniref:Lysosomal dipeptide transporter MFSD1 n=1 Tax=Cryptococcus deneoformans (strain JEC21 / ATCC MYA-565) TaxID=214684 RepID=Q5K8A3_CRYD1|nr:expressed protein [Cryptococcus neoformans var. neoformans JEC21]XP_773429.1 hypothetical protein CNBI0430 [Cryptococcus neoformans var. neoformans B-3501A]AAW46646.1 expressed protein [Cryptococcus neoformans var. neoformans JEC21]EAL18782.1 hypothetical protein CNBI0430 [Cryptococcus neoformans var. neoformans B-3501A]
MVTNHHSPEVIEHVAEKAPSSSSNSDAIEGKEDLAASQYDTISGQLPELAAVGSNMDRKNEENGPRAGEELETVIPLAYRLIAFSMILFFATGSSYMQSVASPLKSTFKEKLNINNAQYGTISSASSLVNTILPIIGGIGMDYWGATYAAIISSIFVLVGAIIAAAASNAENYGMLIGGLILMGFGSTVIESTQNKLYSHWFRGTSLGLVFAVDIAWNRITSVIAKNTAVPMSTINGWWGWALWIPAIVCAVNMAVVMLYWWYERAVPKKYRPLLGKDARVKEGWDKRKFQFGTLRRLPKFFWIFCGSQLFQNAAVSVYTSNLADIQTVTRGTSTLAAGYNSSLQSVIPIFLTPLTGFFFDKIGWRMPFVSFTGALYIIVFALIGLTTVHPLCPILISSFALSTNAITFIASIPILVGDDSLLGTALGIWKAFANGNSIVLDVAAGAIQDRSSNGSYNNVIYFIIAIKGVQVLLGPTYYYLDRRWLAGSLRMTEENRLAKLKEVKENNLDYEGWRVSKMTAAIVGFELIGLIITAWVVYIIYSLGT